MRVALVAMPWNKLVLPSPALGILAAAVRLERPDYQLDCKLPYMQIAELIGTEVYSAIGSERLCGDIIYAGHLYPDQKQSIKEYFVRKMQGATHQPRFISANSPSVSISYEDLYEQVFQATQTHLEELANALAGNYHVVGFTTTYIQLFASLAASQRLKQVDPTPVVVLGGAGVALEAGPSILDEYPFVDYVIQGDGERQFLDLLASVESGALRGSGGRGERCIWPDNRATITSDLDQLPVPDYDEYAQLAKEHGSLYWHIPIEGSRSCWWDRARRTGNPMDACCFCNLNGSTYREKSEATIAREMQVLSTRYSNFKFRFSDCVMRPRGVAKLATAIKDLDKKFHFFYEVRPSIHPYELMLLWEAGCREVQMGVEGLSSSYMHRIGKGTTTLQNLQAMKTCFELGISSMSNLLTDFPGSTQAEVEETVHNILNYAVAYQPLTRSVFKLERNSCVYQLPERYAVSNVRNAEEYKVGLPEDVWRRLRLYALDYDYRGVAADWSAIGVALEAWRSLHRTIREDLEGGAYFSVAPLYYEDRDAYMEIIDRRNGYRVIELDHEWREVYLYCMEIRSARDMIRHFAGRYSEETLKDMLSGLAAEKLIFAEEGKYLSLAVATFPHIAAERIRKAQMASDSQ